MTAIAKTDQSASKTATVAATKPRVLWPALCKQVQAAMQRTGAHPARTVVLLPFYQLQATARLASAGVWQAGHVASFTPRWETTKSWGQRVGCFVPQVTDLRFDAAHDSLQAASFIAQAGLADKQAMLVPALVAAAQQLGGAVAAVPPAQRAGWAIHARAAVVQGLEGLEANPLLYEAAVARIALEWALASRYETDVLFDAATGAQLDCLVIVQGLQANPLAAALAAHWGSSKHGVSSTAAFDALPQSPHVQLHAAVDAADEADRAAACVLQHLVAGRTPVALAAVDRLLTRRISATLALHGVAVLDETGWKLSTTRAAAAVMALLRAASWDAGDDARLDWLKQTNLDTRLVNALEKAFRLQNMPVASVDSAQAAMQFIANDGTAVHPDTLLRTLSRPRSITQWLESLVAALRTCGMWDGLMQDEAGASCIAALLLQTPESVAQYSAPMGLKDFSAWVQATLEAASFKARQADQTLAPVTVLPLAQVLARPFAALVLPGADETRLPRSPDPVGSWSNAQREALGLPSREALAAEQARVWQCALALPHVDVLWRRAEGEQVVQPSLLVQTLLAVLAPQHAADPRTLQAVQPQPSAMPQPTAGSLQITRLSASAYEDLRTCPYRYFALRLLGLQDAPELDAEVDKRDFGSWLHAVLADFHQRRKLLAPSSGTAQANQTEQANNTAQAQGKVVDDAKLLDQCALDQQTPGSGFIPFAASWPQVRASYLAWLYQHEGAGWQFDVSELKRERAHAGIQLNGRLDRVDRLSRGPTAGTAMVLDYKTEAAQTSKDRVRDPLEDTQLAFYAALLGEDDIEAAYVNIAEKETQSTPQPELMMARDALLDGIDSDVARIHAGTPMPALGEGKACDFCAARGLCRKDFWTV